MTSTPAFEMAMVHRAFRNELHGFPALINSVHAEDVKRAAVVNAHLSFIGVLLHHHHAAEDDLIWPKLHARAPVGDHDICRMEDEHRAIAAGIDTAKATGSVWAKTGAPSAAKRLRTAVDELIGLVDVHLDDEERDVVPLIEEYITAAGWKKATAPWCVDSAHSSQVGTGLRGLHARRGVQRRQAPLPCRCPVGRKDHVAIGRHPYL